MVYLFRRVFFQHIYEIINDSLSYISAYLLSFSSLRVKLPKNSSNFSPTTHFACLFPSSPVFHKTRFQLNRFSYPDEPVVRRTLRMDRGSVYLAFSKLPSLFSPFRYFRSGHAISPEISDGSLDSTDFKLGKKS